MKHFDVVVYGKRRNPVVLVEIKAQENIDDETRQFYLEDLLEDGKSGGFRYILLISFSKAWLWKIETGGAKLLTEIDFTKVLQEFRSSDTNQDIGEYEQWMIVSNWLTDLTGYPKRDLSEEEKRLGTDFLDQVAGGYIQSTEAAWI